VASGAARLLIAEATPAKNMQDNATPKAGADHPRYPYPVSTMCETSKIGKELNTSPALITTGDPVPFVKAATMKTSPAPQSPIANISVNQHRIIGPLGSLAVLSHCTIFSENVRAATKIPVNIVRNAFARSLDSW
jgi:hypothetical protein